MKEITLRAAHYKALRKSNGVYFALNAFCADIRKQVPSLPIELRFDGPNHENERVASLAFVRAAILRPSRYGVVEPNLLTCGFAKTDDHAAEALLITLMKNHELLPSPTVAVEDETGDAEKVVYKTSRLGLVVGSFKEPEAFVTFEV